MLCYIAIQAKIPRKVNGYPILITYPGYFSNIFAHIDKTVLHTDKITADLESAGKNT